MWKRAGIMLVVAAGLIAVLLLSQYTGRPLVVSGFIEADEIRLGSRVGGRVSSVHIEEGQVVSAGELLVRLDPYDLLERRAEAEAAVSEQLANYERLRAGFRDEEIDQAKAARDELAAQLDKLVHGPRPQEIQAAKYRLELAESNLDLAKSNHKRAQELHNQKAISNEDMERAVNELRSAQAQAAVRREELALLQEGTRPEEILEAQAQLEQAEQAWKLKQNGYRTEDIDQAQASLFRARAALQAIDQAIKELDITSPVPGVVEAVELQPGDLVAPNAPVLSILDTSKLWVRAYVPEGHLGIQTGQKVEVTVDSYPDRFAAHISFVSRQAEFTPRNIQTPEERSKQVFRIKVMLDEGLDRLRPGMSADVWLESGSKP